MPLEISGLSFVKNVGQNSIYRIDSRRSRTEWKTLLVMMGITVYDIHNTLENAESYASLAIIGPSQAVVGIDLNTSIPYGYFRFRVKETESRSVTLPEKPDINLRLQEISTYITKLENDVYKWKKAAEDTQKVGLQKSVKEVLAAIRMFEWLRRVAEMGRARLESSDAAARFRLIELN